MRSGAAAGGVIRLSGVEGDLAIVEPGQDELLAALAVGDEVALDNSSFLAAQTYHRHQVPGPEYAVWDQFRDADGAPELPQRPMLLGPLITQGASGTVPTGRITGKMIVVACLLDREAFPWQADWYRSRVEEHLGEASGDRFRLWYVDNALHGDDDPQEFPARSVAYVGALEVALRQLAAWVEDGIEPSPTTAYEIVDGQVVVPADRRRAARRAAGRHAHRERRAERDRACGRAGDAAHRGRGARARRDRRAPRGGDGCRRLRAVRQDASTSTRPVAWSSRSSGCSLSPARTSSPCASPRRPAATRRIRTHESGTSFAQGLPSKHDRRTLDRDDAGLALAGGATVFRSPR